MAFSDLTALRAALAAPSQPLSITKAHTHARTLTSFGWVSSWLRNGIPGIGAAPGATPLQPTNATAGSLGQLDASAGSLYMALRKVAIEIGAGIPGSDNVDGAFKLMIADRLAHVSGMSGIVTTAQNTGGMGLTRSTNGVGVMAALEIYTLIGSTLTTATVSYTNQAGTAGRTSQPIAFGGTGQSSVSRFLPISLQAGDTGVRDVASVTLAASTLTAGDFGVTLYKPVLMVPLVSTLAVALDGDPIKACGGFLPTITNGACLWALTNIVRVGGTLGCALVAEAHFMEA